MKGNVMITLLISIPFSIVFIGALVLFWYRHHITNNVTRHRVRLQLFRHISRERLQNQDVERGGLYYGPPMPRYTSHGWMRPSRRHYGEPVELEYLNRHRTCRDPSRHRAQDCRRAGAPHSSSSAEQGRGKPVKTGQKKGKASQDNNKQNNKNEGREPPRNRKKKKKNQKADNDDGNKDKDTNNENTQNSSQQEQQEQTKKNNNNRRQNQTRDEPSKKKQKDQGAETSWGNQSQNNDDQDQPQNANQQQDQADIKESRRQNRGQNKSTRQNCEKRASEEGWGNHSQNDDNHGQSHNENGGWGADENEDWKGQNNHDQDQSQNDNWGTADNQQPEKAPEKEDWDGNGSEQGSWGQQAERNEAMDNAKNNDGW